MNVKQTMAVPSIHLNGTSKAGLLEQLCTAFNAVGDAIKALAQSAPHQRDYYIQPSGAYESARAQHYERMQKLQQVRDELQTLAEAIDRGGYGAVSR